MSVEELRGSLTGEVLSAKTVPGRKLLQEELKVSNMQEDEDW